MLRELLFITLVSTFCCGLGRDDEPGFQYFWQIRGCLKLHRQRATWLNAWAICLHEDAQLTAPWSYEFISTVHELQYSDGRQPHVLYSGARVTLPPYDGGAFASRGKKYWDLCGVWYLNGTRGQVDCNQRLPFTCFLPASAPSPAAVCVAPDAVVALPPAPTTSPDYKSEYNFPHITSDPRCGELSVGYEYTDRTDRCYKFHNKGARWQVANRSCVAEGGRLAVPDSPKATHVLRTLYGRHPYEYIQGAYGEHAAIGIYRDEGVWKTIDGRTLEQVGYANWRSDQPGVNDKPYGYINRAGEIRNWAINEFTTFICEKAPATLEKEDEY